MVPMVITTPSFASINVFLRIRSIRGLIVIVRCALQYVLMAIMLTIVLARVRLFAVMVHSLIHPPGDASYNALTTLPLTQRLFQAKGSVSITVLMELILQKSLCLV